MDIGRSFNQAWEGIFGFLPNLFGFLLLLLVGWVVARVVGGAVGKGLEKAGLDRKVQESDANKYVERMMGGAQPSRGIARVVFWLIFVFFLVAAIGALDIPALTAFMNSVLAYLPNVIAALIIFVVAAMLAGAVAAAAARFLGDTPTGKIAGTVLSSLIMVIALFMVLEQLRIAEEIVRIAFAATMFALALGLALAFGLGGRPVAERMLEDAYRKGQEQKDQVKRDMEAGRQRAREEARQRSGGDHGDSGAGYQQAGGYEAGGGYAAGGGAAGYAAGSSGTFGGGYGEPTEESGRGYGAAAPGAPGEGGYPEQGQGGYPDQGPVEDPDPTRTWPGDEPPQQPRY